MFRRAVSLIIITGLVFIACKKETTQPQQAQQNTASFTATGNAMTIYNSTIVTDGTLGSAYGIYQYVGSKWSNIGSVSTNQQIEALTVYNGNLIAAGNFTSIGGVAVHCIAMWDGSSWHPLGSGFNNTVCSLIVYNGNLIAGGAFDTNARGVANKIAQWNGTTWLPMADSGMQVWSQAVFALTVYNGNLVIGGNFSFLGKSVSATNIATFNGTSWATIGAGSGLNAIRTLTIYNGNLIAGGTFVDVIGSDSAKCIAQWNGTNWATLGTLKIGTAAYNQSPGVLTITNYNNALIVGGAFINLGPSYVYSLIQWNGTSWASPFGTIEDYYTVETTPGHPMLTNGPDIIYSTLVYKGNLIISGTFNSIAGVTINGIAQWNGSSWSAL